MTPFIRFALCAGLMIAGSPSARSDANADRVHDRIMSELVEPGYAALAAAAASHAAGWKAFCGKPARAGFADLKDSFGRVADAWAAIEFARSGRAAEN